MRVNLRFLRTSAFRLTGLYLLFFSLSICFVLGYVYLRTLNLLERQNEETIKAEVMGLTDQFTTGGTEALTLAVKRRVESNHEMQFMLADPSGKYIAGNLHAQPINDMPDNTWVDFSILRGDEKATVGHMVRGFNV